MERDGLLGGSFAWVAQYPLCDDLAYMKAALETNGWTPESHVTVLADGADGLNNLVCAAMEKATRKILDWFHISMRLRPIEQMSRGVAVVADGSQAVARGGQAAQCTTPNVERTSGTQRWIEWEISIYRARTCRTPHLPRIQTEYGNSGSTL